MNVLTIQNVRGYLNNEGTAYLHIEDVARGLGFTQVKNDIEYIRWETVFGYLQNLSFSQPTVLFLMTQILMKIGLNQLMKKERQYTLLH